MDNEPGGVSLNISGTNEAAALEAEQPARLSSSPSAAPSTHAPERPRKPRNPRTENRPSKSTAANTAESVTNPHAGRSPAQPKRPKLTHFLAIPLHTPLLQPALDALRTDPCITALNIHPNAFRPAPCIHLTLGTLSCLTPDKLHTARDLLRSLDLTTTLRACSAPSLSTLTAPSLPAPSPGSPSPLQNALPTPPAPSPPDPLVVSLKGIRAFGKRVLYAVPHEPRLQTFAEAVREVFVEAGMLEDKGPLTLHATLVNMTYAPGKKGKKVEWAGVIAGERFRDWEFGSMRVQGVGLFEMGAESRDGVKGAGGYRCVEMRRFEEEEEVGYLA